MSAVEANLARLWTMRACLPTISAPLYETIHTGLSRIEHGLLSTEMLCPSRHPIIFSELRNCGRITGAVAHSYFHTLFGGMDFDPFEHVEIDDANAPILHACHYSLIGKSQANPTMPSEYDLCDLAWVIARDHKPDYLLLHNSSCDTLGHHYTSEGRGYRIQASQVDQALARPVLLLQPAGYDVLVTADQGMIAGGHHAGNETCLREVPFFSFCDWIEA